MNSRERVLKAIRHEEPDKVPIDFGGMRSTGIMASAYNKLKKYLGIEEGEIKVYDIMQQLATIEPPILELFEVDVVPLDMVRATFGLSNEKWKPYTLSDGTPALISSEFDPVIAEDGGTIIRDKDGIPIAKMPAGGYWFDAIYFPLASATTIDDLKKFDWESLLLGEDELELLSKNAKELYGSTDRAIMGGFGGNLLETGQLFLCGYEKFMFDLAAAPKFVEYMLDRVVEVHLENLRRYLEAVGDYIQIIQMGDDLGTQVAPQISPAMYRELFKPRHKKIYNYIKDNSDICVFLHSCGSIYKLIPDLIEAGVDILNPVQTSAVDMEPERLKREFGDKITFWGGGCDTQRVLLMGTPEEVREHVKRRLKIFAPGGGFVFTQVHNILAEVPPENVVAMFETVEEYRDYPIEID